MNCRDKRRVREHQTTTRSKSSARILGAKAEKQSNPSNREGGYDLAPTNTITCYHTKVSLHFADEHHVADSSENAELRLFGHTIFALLRVLFLKNNKLTYKLAFYCTVSPKYGTIHFKTLYIYTKSSSLALSVCGAQ